MKLDLDLKTLKEKISGPVLIVIMVVVLIGLLIFATYYTVSEGDKIKDQTYSVKDQYTSNVKLVSDLSKLKANSEYYLAQKEKYDEVIADNGTYSVKGYYIELDNLCRKHNLTINSIEVGEMQQTENVNAARSSITVSGDESDICNMAKEIVSKKEITRIDDFALAPQEDGSMQAVITIVNFTK